MTQPQSPALWAAAWQCFIRYLGYLVIVLLGTVLAALIVLPVSPIVFIAANLVAVALASFKATRTCDASTADKTRRARGWLLVLSFCILLLIPWAVLSGGAILVAPDTMVGGYLMFGALTFTALIAPICILIGTVVGVFMAR